MSYFEFDLYWYTVPDIRYTSFLPTHYMVDLSNIVHSWFIISIVRFLYISPCEGLKQLTSSDSSLWFSFLMLNILLFSQMLDLPYYMGSFRPSLNSVYGSLVFSALHYHPDYVLITVETLFLLKHLAGWALVWYSYPLPLTSSLFSLLWYLHLIIYFQSHLFSKNKSNLWFLP